MEISNRELSILANWIICAIGAGVAICRMGQMNRWETKAGIQVIYLAYLMLFISSAISWWWGDEPTRIQIGMGFAVLIALLVGLPAWRGGAPAHTMKRFSYFMEYLKKSNAAGLTAAGNSLSDHRARLPD